MALSDSVKDNLKEAESSLRAALSFASRQERSTCCVSNAKLINELEKITALDDVQDNLDEMMNAFNNRKKGDNNHPFNPFT